MMSFPLYAFCFPLCFSYFLYSCILVSLCSGFYGIQKHKADEKTESICWLKILLRSKEYLRFLCSSVIINSGWMTTMNRQLINSRFTWDLLSALTLWRLEHEPQIYLFSCNQTFWRMKKPKPLKFNKIRSIFFPFCLHRLRNNSICTLFLRIRLKISFDCHFFSISFCQSRGKKFLDETILWLLLRWNFS